MFPISGENLFKYFEDIIFGQTFVKGAKSSEFQYIKKYINNDYTPYSFLLLFLKVYFKQLNETIRPSGLLFNG